MQKNILRTSDAYLHSDAPAGSKTADFMTHEECELDDNRRLVADQQEPENLVATRPLWTPDGARRAFIASEIFGRPLSRRGSRR